jgi:predicted Zn-dependent protease
MPASRGMGGRFTGLVLAGLLVAGCRQAPVAPRGGSPGQSAGKSAKPHQPLLGLSRQQELELGQQAAEALARQEGLARAPELEQRLTAIANRLAPHTAEPSYKYDVHILASSEVNAMSLPDDTVFVTRGFITQLHPTEEDYAAVLGHEINHVAQHHMSRRVASQREAGIVLTLLALLTHRNNAVAAGQVLGALAQLQFSRGQEYEADLKGADALAAAGYNPVAMVHLLQKLEQLHPSPSRFQIGLSNHPATRDRIAKVQHHILVDIQGKAGVHDRQG